MIAGLALVSAAVPPALAADDQVLRDAWMKKEQATLKYRTSVRALGKATPEDRARLKREIIDPAQKEYRDTRGAFLKQAEEKWKDALKKSIPRNLEYYKKKFAALFRGAPGAGKAAGTTAGTGPADDKSKVNLERAERKNVTVEGTDIPDEMEFGAGEAKPAGDEAEMVFSGKKLKRQDRKNVTVDPQNTEDMEFSGGKPKAPASSKP